MTEKEFKAGDDNKHSWARALLKKSWSSGPTPDMPPPYTPEERVIAAKEPNTLHSKIPFTSYDYILEFYQIYLLTLLENL
ncbi:hypothetical protein FRB94_001562 [Tulasnella sp. JGI-2019a]|nr:hypothetical protein FRB94_001562 [Tulasnella sp. JGI-2019a]